jgi:regulator of replication initiation timing
MSTEYPKISIKLQELINQANNSFPSTGEAIMAAYNQACEEGHTPRQAKNILYNNVHFLDERTIRRYLPLEAKDTEKIRTRPPTAENGPQKSGEKDHFLSNQGNDRGEVIPGTINKQENAAPDSSSKNILSFSMTIMKLENILKNKDKYVIELLERNEGLNIENRKLKEEKQAQETNLSGEALKVKAYLSPLYRDVLLLRQSNASQVNILISNGKYIKLEPT